MPTGRNPAPWPSGSFRFPSSGRGLQQGAARLAAALVCAAVLAGCGEATLDLARGETEDVARRVSALREAPGQRFSAIRVIERRPWLGLTRTQAAPGSPLPARFLGADAVTLPLAGIGEAGVLARRIEAATGMAVRFTGEAAANGGASGGASLAGIDRLSPDGGVWTGPLDALLDAWTSPAGYAWRYDDGEGAIEIVRRQALVFRVNALAGTQSYAGLGLDRRRGLRRRRQRRRRGRPHQPVDLGGDRLRPLARDRAPDRGARRAGHGGGGGALERIAAGERHAAGHRPGAGLSRLAQPRGAAPGHPLGARLLGEPGARGRLRDRDRGDGGRAVRHFCRARALARVGGGDQAVGFGGRHAVGDGSGRSRARARCRGCCRPTSPRSTASRRSSSSSTRKPISRRAAPRRATASPRPSWCRAWSRPGFAVSYIPRITGPGEVLVRLFASLRDRPVFREYASGGRSIQLPAYASRVSTLRWTAPR